jgi:Carboxypeptidase regulatory-like domain
MTLQLLLLAVSLIVTSAHAYAGGARQSARERPARDNARAATGTAKISGRVISAETGAPIRRAQIRVTSRDAGMSREATTDGDGRFELLSLPRGRYRLYVARAGYVTLEYGQTRPFEAGKPLDIVDGQSLERVDFNLPRGSVIAGRITDEVGDPVTDVQVQAMRYQFTGGERQLVNAGRTSTTDDLGQFRVFGLMPGDYIVRASMRGNNNLAATSRDAAQEPEGYPGTYYPGVIEPAQAQVVTVALGQEVSSVAFPLVRARLSRISGTVTSAEGRPLTGALVMLRAIGSGGARLNVGGGNQVGPDGTFRLSNVPPGEYVLHVQERPQNVSNVGSPDFSDAEFASVAISVSADIEGLAVITTRGVTASGRIAFPGGSKVTLRGVQVRPSPPQGMPSAVALAGRALGRVNEDGTFELRGLHGPQLIRATGLPEGWMVKSISLDGADITDVPFEFRPGTHINSLVITLTDRVTHISGAVRDGRGQAVGDYVLVVFSEDPKLWSAPSRHVATARPDQNGSFSIKGLPAARYLAAVVPALEDGMQNDAALLLQLRAHAESFTLAEGQALNLNLEIPPQ